MLDTRSPEIAGVRNRGHPLLPESVRNSDTLTRWVCDLMNTHILVG